MKINVTVTVDIDPDAWVEEYGVERNEVRADVKQFAQSTIWSQLDAAGVLSR